MKNRVASVLMSITWVYGAHFIMAAESIAQELSDIPHALFCNVVNKDGSPYAEMLFYFNHISSGKGVEKNKSITYVGKIGKLKSVDFAIIEFRKNQNGEYFIDDFLDSNGRGSADCSDGTKMNALVARGQAYQFLGKMQ